VETEEVQVVVAAAVGLDIVAQQRVSKVATAETVVLAPFMCSAGRGTL